MCTKSLSFPPGVPLGRKVVRLVVADAVVAFGLKGLSTGQAQRDLGIDYVLDLADE